MAAEYIAQRGNLDIVLCERGIRTFETATRNTLDISAVPVAHGLSHLPVIVDPSHSGGRRDLVVPLSRAAIAVGADGIIVDVHPHPEPGALRRAAGAGRRRPAGAGRGGAPAAAAAGPPTRYRRRTSGAEHASRPLDVVVVDVEVGDRAQVPPVEQAEQHALLAAGGHDVGRVASVSTTTMLVSTVAGSTHPGPPRPSARRAAGLARGRRPAARRGGPARAARPPPGCPTCRIPPPSRLRHTRSRRRPARRSAEQRPDRRAQPLGQADRHGVEQSPVRRELDAARDVRVPQPGAVEVQRPRLRRRRPSRSRCELGQRLHGAAAEVVRVLDGDRGGRRPGRARRPGASVAAHRVGVDQPAVRAAGAGRDAGRTRRRAELGPHDVGVGVADQLLRRAARAAGRRAGWPSCPPG